MFLENVPKELRRLPNWVFFKIEERKNKTTAKINKTKVLYQDGEHRARANDPNTWTAFTKVRDTDLKNLGLDGIGFVFYEKSGLVGVDFDHVRDKDTGVIDPEAHKEILKLNSYTEVSPSGTGIHVILKGSVPGGAGRNNREKCREMYGRSRFFTFTGNTLPEYPTEVKENQQAINELYKEWFGEVKDYNVYKSSTVEKPKRGDIEIISLCKSKNPTFVKLMEGGWDQLTKVDKKTENKVKIFPSGSEADYGLCKFLLKYTEDIEQIRRIGLQSSLITDEEREKKWKREDYLKNTIQTVLKHRRDYEKKCTLKAIEKPTLTDEEIIERCKKDENNFSKLFSGGWEEIADGEDQFGNVRFTYKINTLINENTVSSDLIRAISKYTYDIEQIKRIGLQSNALNKCTNYKKKWLSTEDTTIKDLVETFKEIDLEIAQEKKEKESLLYPFKLLDDKVIKFEDKRVGKEIIQVSKTIVSCPVSITALSENLDDNPSMYQLSLKHPFDGDKNLWVTQEEFLTRNGVVKLIKDGVMCTEKSYSDFGEYMMKDMYRAKEENVPKAFCAAKPGWKRNDSIFISGNTAYTKEGERLANLTDKTSAEMYGCKGTLEGWKSPSVLKWLEFPVTRFCCYVAGSGMLCSLLGVQNIIASIIGNTSRGKTTSGIVAGSMFGIAFDGDHIKRSASITQTAAEKLSVSINGHFVLFDETKGGSDYEPIVYMLANGATKGRAPNSVLEKGESFAASYIFTGESALLSESVAQGANGRLITLENPIPASDENAELSRDIRLVIKENYGHIKSLFINKIFSIKDKLYDRYKVLLAKFRNTDRDIGARIGDMIACICIAGEILEEVFSDIGIKRMDHIKICSDVMTENINSEQKKEYWLRGLETVYNEVSTWQRNIDEEKGEYGTLLYKGRVGGKRETKYIHVAEAVLKDVCENNKLNKTELIKMWKEKEITKCDKNEKDGRARYNHTVKLNNETVKCITLIYEKLEDVLNLEVDDTWGILSAQTV